MNMFAQRSQAASGTSDSDPPSQTGGAGVWLLRRAGAASGLARGTLLLVLSLFLVAVPAAAQSLAGSRTSVDLQNRQANAHDFSYLETADDVHRFVELGYVVPVVPTDDLEIHQVSFPYARPEVRVFLQRLSSQYHAHCGEKLVVTSLMRPASAQPRNASSRSVHPTGMAVDLRRSNNPTCRSWLESTLLTLEARGVLEATRERNPPHYHLAVFPDPYIQYVAQITGSDRVMETLNEGPTVEIEWVRHTVRSGENLNLIARRYGTAVARIQAENGVRGSRIQVGQVLRVPVYRTVKRVASSSAGPFPAGDGGSSAGEGPSSERSGSERSSADDSGTRGSARGPVVGNAPVGEGSSAEPGGAGIHVVSRGESIWAVARRYGVSELELKRANGLASARIDVGQELVIPGPTGSNDATSSPGPRTHEVRAGESLWAIARLYGVTIRELQEVNGLASGAIHPGQQLDVPTDS